jgi:hypothetical protein
MPIGFILKNGWGRPNPAKVSKRGQLITGPLEYSETYFNSMTSAGVAYNFIGPKSGKRFVVNGFIMSSDKDVNATNGAVVPVFEASSPTDTVGTKTLLELDVGKLGSRQLTGLNLLTNSGVWLNSKTDDATVNLTIIGYYVDV